MSVENNIAHLSIPDQYIYTGGRRALVVALLIIIIVAIASSTEPSFYTPRTDFVVVIGLVACSKR